MFIRRFLGIEAKLSPANPQRPGDFTNRRDGRESLVTLGPPDRSVPNSSFLS